MCGVAGLFDPRLRGDPGELERLAVALATPLEHRGPDDAGAWWDAEAGLTLGHRRLSIIDLSAAGRQPMVSPSGRYALSFNGEVYNFPSLRKELERHGVGFRGHSDSEVMLAAIDLWGLRAAVRRFVGMFAFAVWDREARELHLVRDRLGIKPLFHGSVDGAFIFASELKGIRAHPEFRPEVDRDVLALYLRHGYVPGPHCIYRGIRKLPPGSILTVSASTLESPRIERYWSAREVAEVGTADPFAGTDEEAIDAFERRLREAVDLRMVADVPLGAFLSGGYDSSLVVALMQQVATGPVRTFSIGFELAEFDEARFAKEVARHVGTEHTELYVTACEARDVIPSLPAVYDEPFADPSEIPTTILCELTRRHVKVALSGDGGDELFAGYTRYARGRRIWTAANRMGGPLRLAAARGSRTGARLLQRWDGPGIPWGSGRHTSLARKLEKLSCMLAADRREAIYGQLLTHWLDGGTLATETRELPTPLTDPEEWAELPSFLEWMMWVDLGMYLPDDILTKVDRASMRFGLEVRVPLLDHRVVELAWRFPARLKVRDGSPKWLLRQALYRHVPASLVDRPKQGFTPPIAAWLRGPLRPWAEELLDAKRLEEEGFFHPPAIRRKWEQHLAGTHDWYVLLWDVLTFQAWHAASAE